MPDLIEVFSDPFASTASTVKLLVLLAGGMGITALLLSMLSRQRDQ